MIAFRLGLRAKPEEGIIGLTPNADGSASRTLGTFPRRMPFQTSIHGSVQMSGGVASGYNGAAAASPTGGLEMAEGTTQGILLMSDISGYSEFVHRHTRSAGHARQITVRLLKAIVSASRPVPKLRRA